MYLGSWFDSAVHHGGVASAGQVLAHIAPPIKKQREMNALGSLLFLVKSRIPAHYTVPSIRVALPSSVPSPPHVLETPHGDTKKCVPTVIPNPVRLNEGEPSYVGGAHQGSLGSSAAVYPNPCLSSDFPVLPSSL